MCCAAQYPSAKFMPATLPETDALLIRVSTYTCVHHPYHIMHTLLGNVDELCVACICPAKQLDAGVELSIQHAQQA
jgi:hypothetical protein